MIKTGTLSRLVNRLVERHKGERKGWTHQTHPAVPIRGLLSGIELNETSRAIPTCRASENRVSRVRKCDTEEKLIAAHHLANGVTTRIQNIGAKVHNRQVKII